MGFSAFTLALEKETKLVTHNNVVCKVSVENLVSQQSLQSYGHQIRQQLSQLIKVALFNGIDFGRLRVVSSHCYFYCETCPWSINAYLNFKKDSQELHQQSFFYLIRVKDRPQPQVAPIHIGVRITGEVQDARQRAISSNERLQEPSIRRAQMNRNNNSNSELADAEHVTNNEQTVQLISLRNTKAIRTRPVKKGAVTRKLNLRDSEAESLSETSEPGYNLRQSRHQQLHLRSPRTRKVSKRASLSLVRRAKKSVAKQLGKKLLHVQQKGRVRQAPKRYGFSESSPQRAVDLIADEENRLRQLRTPLRRKK